MVYAAKKSGSGEPEPERFNSNEISLALGEAGSGTQLRPWRGLGLCAGQRLRRLRRSRAHALGERFVIEQEFQLVGVKDFAFEQSLRDALEGIAVLELDTA